MSFFRPRLSSSSFMAIESPSYYDEKNAKAIESIEELTKNVDSVQKRVLAEILSQNANAEYLQRFKLNGATDRESFKSKVPVITYEDIKPDIQRVANGDKSPIFSSQPISEFLVSSGTSAGEIKIIPSIQEDIFRKVEFSGYSMPILNLYISGLDKGKCLDFIFTQAGSRTPSGILVQGALSSIYKNPHYNSRPYNPYHVLTSPVEATLCTDSFQSMYSQMLCGLLMRAEVLRLGAMFASGILRAIRFLQLNWKQLCHDIKTGTLNPRIVTDPSVRDCMSKILFKPNPELAELIEKECESENWERIIPRIWPHAKYLQCIVTGTMAQYIPSLDYYSGGLPLVCTNYSSSECLLGINLRPLSKPSEVSYTIMPNMAYFEFIHHNNDLANSDSSITSEYRLYLVDLANLEIGKEYEIVITTYAGLYRYRMGDILQVTGFHNAAPQLTFVKRKDVVLSIDVDKTSEVELQKGIDNASALLRPYNVDVMEYTSCVDVKTIPGHYVIYWELLVKDARNEPRKDVLNECCLAIEESLNWLYKRKRGEQNTIGPLEIRVVKNGTFEELMEYAISRGSSISQYKVPRCVSFTPIVKLLDSNVVSTHFSPAVPHPSPDIPSTLIGSTASDFHSIT